MIKQIIIPAFCVTHMVQFDRANRFGCVECYVEGEVASKENELEQVDREDDTVTAKQELGDELTKQRDKVVETIMKHIDDCVDGIGNKEELSAGIDEEIEIYIEDCVEWS